MIFFTICSSKSEAFKKQTGEISFKDFYKFKYYYLSFCIIFICNMLSSFYGNQLVLNVSMYVTLRKLVLVMIFFLDFFCYKKPIKLLTIFCVFLITFGTVLISMDDFTYDYLGYFVVIINNTLTIIYVKFSENFKKKTKVTNLKLLVYNSYLSNPILIAAIFISGEYKYVSNYFNDINENNFYYGFLFFLFTSCFFCVILNSSFLLSNEKNSSLFTQLLSNSKDILISILSYFVFKNNKLTLKIIIGLIISTIGALLFSMKSISENLIFNKKEKEKEEFELEDKEKV
jgi:drug/metabolite transporter (DMT)-like permease